jgi:hypothetical protein
VFFFRSNSTSSLYVRSTLFVPNDSDNIAAYECGHQLGPVHSASSICSVASILSECVRVDTSANTPKSLDEMPLGVSNSHPSVCSFSKNPFVYRLCLSVLLVVVVA